MFHNCKVISTCVIWKQSAHVMSIAISKLWIKLDIKCSKNVPWSSKARFHVTQFQSQNWFQLIYHVQLPFTPIKSLKIDYTKTLISHSNQLFWKFLKCIHFCPHSNEKSLRTESATRVTIEMFSRGIWFQNPFNFNKTRLTTAFRFFRTR